MRLTFSTSPASEKDIERKHNGAGTFLCEPVSVFRIHLFSPTGISLWKNVARFPEIETASCDRAALPSLNDTLRTLGEFCQDHLFSWTRPILQWQCSECVLQENAISKKILTQDRYCELLWKGIVKIWFAQRLQAFQEVGFSSNCVVLSDWTAR